MTGSIELTGTAAGGVGAGTAWSGDAPLITPEPWMQGAACASADPDEWFPSKGGTDMTRTAKKVCAGCDVQAECLAYALEHNETFGIWGGLSPVQRRRLKQRMADAS